VFLRVNYGKGRRIDYVFHVTVALQDVNRLMKGSGPALFTLSSISLLRSKKFSSLCFLPFLLPFLLPLLLPLLVAVWQSLSLYCILKWRITLSPGLLQDHEFSQGQALIFAASREKLPTQTNREEA